MTDSTRDMLMQHMEGTRETLKALYEHTGMGSDEEHDQEACDICSQYPDVTPDEAGRQYMDELPLEVVKRVGTPLAILLTYGGPNIEVVQDVRGGGAYLEGSWGGETVKLYGGDALQWVIDYFIDRDDL